MLDQMTHSFEMKLGTVTGTRDTITGFIEFNTDGKVSHEYGEISKPIKPETMAFHKEIMNLMKRVYDFHGDIIKIEIKKLPTP